MNAVENYKSILESIFSVKVDFLDTNLTNNCIGALNNQNNFTTFKNNFIKLITRLNNKFCSNPVIILEIITKAKNIGQTKGYKWSGPYSELVALDYFSQNKNLMDMKFPDRGDVNKYPDSIAKDIGKSEIDLDISFKAQYTKIYMDVKSLIPTHIELIDKILNELKEKIVDKEYLIDINDLFEVDYLRTKRDYIYELKSGTLISELENCINNKINYYEHTLQSGEKAKFSISYPLKSRNLSLTTNRTFDPYKLAADYKYKILDYYEKLLKDEASLITFVKNPWFNNEIGDFNNFDEVFYRSLSRRVFVELARDHNDMGTIYPKLIGKNIKISDVATLITGIIFINDNSILKKDSDIYDAFIYLNPNSTNKALTMHNLNILNYVSGMHSPYIDDFTNDNY